ncbi:MAG: hypothetical protein Q8Q50_06090 [Methylobacter sp.]|nr:hypothetical protein [Methylobacter sp.]
MDKVLGLAALVGNLIYHPEHQRLENHQDKHLYYKHLTIDIEQDLNKMQPWAQSEHYHKIQLRP